MSFTLGVLFCDSCELIPAGILRRENAFAMLDSGETRRIKK